MQLALCSSVKEESAAQCSAQGEPLRDPAETAARGLQSADRQHCEGSCLVAKRASTRKRAPRVPEALAALTVPGGAPAHGTIEIAVRGGGFSCSFLCLSYLVVKALIDDVVLLTFSRWVPRGGNSAVTTEIFGSAALGAQASAADQTTALDTLNTLELYGAKAPSRAQERHASSPFQQPRIYVAVKLAGMVENTFNIFLKVCRLRTR